MASLTVPLIAGSVFGHDGVHGHAPAPHTPARPPASPAPASDAATVARGRAMFAPVADWGVRSDGRPLGSTHGGVVVDERGRVLLATDTDAGILVLGGDGRVAGRLASNLNGVHALQLRREGEAEFIYAAHLAGKRLVKLDLDGRVVWSLGLPADAGTYDEKPASFNPTSVAVAPDGTVFVADGYGRNWIHAFDAKLRYLRSFGGPGEGPGQFRTCHGLAVDVRGERPRLLVCDRENRRIQRFELDGTFVDIPVTGLRRPCAIAIHDDLAAVAELEGRVTILDRELRIIAHVGDNPNQSHWANFGVPPEEWTLGVFTAPHGVGFDRDGSLYVSDWNRTGRVTKLTRRGDAP